MAADVDIFVFGSLCFALCSYSLVIFVKYNMEDKTNNQEQNTKSQEQTSFIALLTDFGTKDYFVGAMKGAILSINSEARIIDISHRNERHNIASAGFTLSACYEDFPKKTIFVAVVDPGVGSDRRAILVETDDYYFIAPDNGLLSFVFNRFDNFRVFNITKKEYSADQISRTFHGRDIFAPAAAYLSGGAKPGEFGDEIKDFVSFNFLKPTEKSNGDIEAVVIHADGFGNLITNLQPEDLPEKFGVQIGDKYIDKFQKHFSEADTSEVFMIFGSAGYLEIVSFKDSAKEFLGVETGDKIIVKTMNWKYISYLPFNRAFDKFLNRAKL